MLETEGAKAVAFAAAQPTCPLQVLDLTNTTTKLPDDHSHSHQQHHLAASSLLLSLAGLGFTLSPFLSETVLNRFRRTIVVSCSQKHALTRDADCHSNALTQRNECRRAPCIPSPCVFPLLLSDPTETVPRSCWARACRGETHLCRHTQ